MQTASRGGIVAVTVALGIMLARLPWAWRRSQVLGVIASVWIVLGIAAWLPIMHRFGKAMGGQDLSIISRLVLWRAAPLMMLDAPGGWGFGHSAGVFHQWYQPLDQDRLFTSLINSHLTWLVEIGWPWRFLYVFGWLTVLALCWLKRSVLQKHPLLAIPFSLWIVFAITAWFNSVAESYWLWLVPIASLGSILWWRWQARQWPDARKWLGMVICSGAILATLLLLGINSIEHPRLRLRGSRIVLGSSADPDVWLLANREVLGNSYSRTLRRAWQENLERDHGHSMSIGLVSSLDDLPLNIVRAKILVVGGAMDDEQLERLKLLLPVCSKLVLLNPTFFPQALGTDLLSTAKIEVVVGEFSRVPASAWAETMKAPPSTVPGVGDYLPRWPDLLLVSHPQTTQ